MLTLFEQPNELPERPRAAPDGASNSAIMAPGSAILEAKMANLAPKWPQVGVPSASRARPAASPKRPGGPKTNFSTIFVGFWTIFRQFTLEPRATKAQKQNLKKESRDPQRTSWFLRCGLALYCSHVFRSDFRTLHVQPFFVACPQAHLVQKDFLINVWVYMRT